MEFRVLVEKYLINNISADEEKLLAEMSADPANKAILEDLIEKDLAGNVYADEENTQLRNQSFNNILGRIGEDHGTSGNGSETPVYALSKHYTFRIPSWIRYAAILLILSGAGFIFLLENKKLQSGKEDPGSSKAIAPGGNKALLMLADGKTIVLDSSATGNIALQGNTQILRNDNGQIVYNAAGISHTATIWNTLSTPAGGQYQLVLADGTRVWLNAASSITYPASFAKEEGREVKITGEVYFEISTDKQKPFRIDVDGQSKIQVLGTSFNVNAYRNENSVITTLIAGSVKLEAGPGSMILKPGQQAQVMTNTKNIRLTPDPDIEKVLAWKNGLFNFKGSDVKAVMRQLERWYDIRVIYDAPATGLQFDGEMYRNVNLTDVLTALQKMGLKFRLEGKTLTITE